MDVGAGFFYAVDVWQYGQFPVYGDRNINTGAGWDIIENDGDIYGFGNGLIMTDETIGISLVVIRGYDQKSVSTGLLCGNA